MNIPTQIDTAITGIDHIVVGVQASYLRAVGRYWNFEEGYINMDALIPGLSITFERYTNGIFGEGWLLRCRFTDGTDTSEKVIDHGPGGFSTEWTVLPPPSLGP